MWWNKVVQQAEAANNFNRLTKFNPRYSCHLVADEEAPEEQDGAHGIPGPR